MNCYGITIALLLALPIDAKNHLPQWKNFPLRNLQEKKIALKHYCKIAIHSFVLLSGIANCVMCGCLVVNDPREDPTFAEVCLSYTKLGLFGPILSVAGIMGLYEDIRSPEPLKPQPPVQEHIVHIINHQAQNTQARHRSRHFTEKL